MSLAPRSEVSKLVRRQKQKAKKQSAKGNINLALQHEEKAAELNNLRVVSYKANKLRNNNQQTIRFNPQKYVRGKMVKNINTSLGLNPMKQRQFKYYTPKYRRNINNLIYSNRNRVGRAISSKLTDLASKYLCLVGDPFNCVQIARCPDSKKLPSLVLQDFYRATTVSLTGPTADFADGKCYGVLFMLQYGYNAFYSLYAEKNLYSIYYALIDLNGQLIPVNSANPNSIGNLNFTNLQLDAISNIGDGADGGIQTTQRILSAGLQIWPTIELLTNSSTPAMQDIWAGSLSINDVYDNFWENNAPDLSFDNYIANLENAVRYTNSMGASVRLNPFSKVFEEFLTPDQATDEAHDTGGILTPFLYAKFSLGISGTVSGDDTLFTIPLELNARIFLEGTVTFPTPLFPTPSPVDPNWETIKAAVNAMPEEIMPMTASGHSFKSFLQNTSVFMKFLSRFLRYGSDAATYVGNAADSMLALTY